MPIHLTLIVEDSLSEAVARKMLNDVDRDYSVKNAFRWNKSKIKSRINGINKASKGFVYFCFD